MADALDSKSSGLRPVWVQLPPPVLGWLGGLMDHPFRYSDDINRFPIFLMIRLWPGRLIAESMIDTFLLLHARDQGPRIR